MDLTNIPEEDFAAGMACDGWYCYVPAGEKVTEGFDLGLSGEIRPGWNLLAGYAYNSEPFTTRFPKHQVNLSTTYELGRWTVGGQLRYQGMIFAEGEDAVPYRVEQPAYTVVDLMAEYALTEKVSLLFNVDNVFDESYYDGISYPTHGQTFGPPRSAAVTLTAAF